MNLLKINKVITKNWEDMGDLEVTLLKVGKKSFGTISKIRVYLKIKNLGTETIKCFSIIWRVIIIDSSGKQYESSMSADDEKDDFPSGEN